MKEPSPEYLAASEKVRAATKVWNQARQDFRARRISPAEFEKAVATYRAADAEFEAAYALERAR